MTNPANSTYAVARKAVFDIIDALPAHLREMLYQEIELKRSQDAERKS